MPRDVRALTCVKKSVGCGHRDVARHRERLADRAVVALASYSAR
jgi:hypothetical protein